MVMQRIFITCSELLRNILFGVKNDLILLLQRETQGHDPGRIGRGGEPCHSHKLTYRRCSSGEKMIG